MGKQRKKGWKTASKDLKMQNDLKKWKMENDLKNVLNGRQHQKI